MLFFCTTIPLRQAEDTRDIYFEIQFKKHLLCAYYVPGTMLGTEA